MFYDWYLNIKFKMEKKKILKELELEDFVRNKHLAQLRKTCEHSYEIVGAFERKRWVNYCYETWIETHLYCPKCDSERVVNEHDADIILEKQIVRDSFKGGKSNECDSI